jgi:hypothetical protein
MKNVNQQRRQFMVGAAGFTFGVAAGGPVLNALMANDAIAQSGSVRLNDWVTVFTDGTVATFELNVKSFHELRHAVAEALHGMDSALPKLAAAGGTRGLV